MKMLKLGLFSMLMLILTFWLQECQGIKTAQSKYIKVGPDYDYSDNRAASALPPAGLAKEKVPQFVSIGFDDNAFSGMSGSQTSGGLRFVLDLAKDKKNPAGKGNARTYDNAPVHFSFYLVGQYIASKQDDNPVFVRRAMHEALLSGHEIGNHTFSHDHGSGFALTRWKTELDDCTRWMIKPFGPNDDPKDPDISKGIGISQKQVFGFRTPFLEYNDTLFTALKESGFMYDCTIEEGWQDDQDGSNYLWPYTLDDASPGNAKTTKDTTTVLVGKHPGLWEMPNYALIVPPDDKCKEYGVEPGLRAKLAKGKKEYKPEDGKITGIDWNLWVEFQMSKPEFLATLKYSLDLRCTGNRCPFLLGTHSDIYSNSYPDTIANATPQQRRDALAEFLSYALSKPQVRVASMKEVLDWLRNPVAME
jgi:peptidoglycan/xylan/chitin deacetylase (PgdA/CDA1 family)